MLGKFMFYRDFLTLRYVPYPKLITKMKYFGIPVKVINLATRYLTIKKQHVGISGYSAGDFVAFSGVSEGSSLG